MPPPALSVKLRVKALKNDAGATRLFPCQRNSDKVPTPEPGTWRRSQLCPLPMGTAIVRASSPVLSLLQQRSTPRTGADTFYNQDVYSGSGIRAAAGIEEGHPRRAGPDAEAPRSGPFRGGPCLCGWWRGRATKAAVILPKPRVAPVQQPAVKHEEAVSAHTKKAQ